MKFLSRLELGKYPIRLYFTRQYLMRYLSLYKWTSISDLHFKLKDLGFYYLLFHIPYIRNKIKFIEWHHYLGRHSGKAIKWL